MPIHVIPVFLAFKTEDRDTAVIAARDILANLNSGMDDRFVSAKNQFATDPNSDNKDPESPQGYAFRASLCLDAYYGPEDRESNEDTETRLGDLLASLMHLAEQQELDFEECLAKAYWHHKCEVEEAEDATHS